MLLIVLPACHIAIRIGDSSRLYHEDVTALNQPGILFDCGGLSGDKKTGIGLGDVGSGLSHMTCPPRERKYILSVIPGKKGASHKPVTKRTIQKPTPLCPTVNMLFSLSPIDIHLRCNRGHGDRADAPTDHHAGEKNAWADLRQPQISGQLSNEIADIEGRNSSAPHSIAHVEIRL